MPQLYFQVPDYNTSVLNHVAYQMVEALTKDLNIRHLITHGNTTVTSDHLTDSSSSDEDGNLRVTNNRCDVRFTEITNPSRIRWDILKFSNITAYGQSTRDLMDIIPLFADAEAGIGLWEQAKPCNIRLDFTVMLNDKSEALRLENVLTNRYHASSVFNPHDLQYSYTLDKNLLSCLYVLYKLRSTVNLTTHFVDYLKDRSSKELYFEKTPLNENEKRLMFKTHKLNAIALLEYDQEKPEPVTVNRITDRWQLQFSYTLQFTRPDTLLLRFPTVVENTWVPTTVLPEANDTNLTMRGLEGLMEQTSFNTAARRVQGKLPILVRYPSYEDFNPPINTPVGQYGYRPMFIASFTLDEGVTAIDLMDLGDIELHPVALELMKKHGRDIFNDEGLFNVTVYINGVPTVPSRLSVDENLVITVDATDTLKRYHIVISEATNLKHVNRDYVKLMLEYRWFFAHTLMKNVQYLVKQNYYIVVPSPELVNVISNLIYKNLIDGYTQALIDAGHATTELYQMVTSGYQYAEYITTFRSPVSERFIYDELMELLVADNNVRLPLPEAHVRTKQGLSIYRSHQELGHGPFTPFRVSEYRITTE